MFPGNLGPGELMVVGLIAVLLFGKRLPEVGKSLGKGIVEFKKGLRGIDDDEPSVTSTPSTRESTPGPGSIEVNVPKFEPPAAAQTTTGSVASPYQG